MPMVQPNIKQTIKNIVYDLCRLSVYIAALYILYDGDLDTFWTVFIILGIASLDTFWTVFIILGIASCIVNRIKEFYTARHQSRENHDTKTQ